MVLPPELAAAIEDELHGRSIKELRRAAEEMRRRYRGETAARESFERPDDITAYLAFRMPATYAAARSVFEAIRERRPGFIPNSMLDIGAGPGTAMLAAWAVWPSIQEVRLLEKSLPAEAVGERLAQKLFPQRAQQVRWEEGDAGSFEAKGEYDLVVASYALGELSPNAFSVLLGKLPPLVRDTVVVIEPSLSSRVSLLIDAARNRFIQEGFFTVAPCTHDLPCPRREKNWCHFAQRLSRPGFLTAIKEGEQPFEDEKFIYAALSRQPHPRPAGVLLRQPVIRKGHVVLEICAQEGIRSFSIARSQKEFYRLARKLSWGDALQALPPAKK